MTNVDKSAQSGADESGDTPMTRRYVGALVLEAVIIVALWALGRIYS